MISSMMSSVISSRVTSVISSRMPSMISSMMSSVISFMMSSVFSSRMTSVISSWMTSPSPVLVLFYPLHGQGKLRLERCSYNAEKQDRAESGNMILLE